MEKLQNWYKELSKERKIFVYVISFLLLAAFGFGLIPFLVLIYLELGLPNNNAKKIMMYFLGGPIALFLAIMLFLGLVNLNYHYPFVIFFEILLIPIFFISKKLDRNHKASHPEDKGYVWGYFQGITIITLNILGLIAAFFISQTLPEFEQKYNIDFAFLYPNAFGIIISLFFLITAYGVCQRLRIPFIILTIFTLNPVIWVVNYFYIKRRPYLAK
jgi:hypothetical protein